MKTTIPTAPPPAAPSAGATQPIGKSSEPDANLKHTRSASVVVDAQESKGVARRCIDQQLENTLGSSPKTVWNVRNESNMSSDDNDK